MLINIVLPVIPRSKKNGMIKTKHGLIQSAAYRQYESDCLMLMPSGLRNAKLHCPVTVTARFYMPTRRKVDLPNLLNAIDDVLVKSGVLADDNRDIIASHDGSRVLYDKERPRTEITIETYLDHYEQWGGTK